MEKFHKNQPKSPEYNFFFLTVKLMFTDINIYPINKKKNDHIFEKFIFYRKKK